VTVGITANLTDDLLMALDAVAFARAAGIEPDDWQSAVLRSSAPRLLLNVTRQGGKSTITAALAAHTALFRPGSLTLIVSPSQRQSAETFAKMIAVYRAVGRPVPAEAESVLALRLTNGSRVVALPGSESTLRGYSGVALLILDEAARILDDLYYSLRPMLAVSGGRLIAMSTPAGRRGWWFREWAEGGPAFARVEVPATQCPRISPQFLAEEEKALGARWYRQEYLCQFSETSEQIFAYDMLMRAVTSDVTPLFGGSPNG